MSTKMPTDIKYRTHKVLYIFQKIRFNLGNTLYCRASALSLFTKGTQNSLKKCKKQLDMLWTLGANRAEETHWAEIFKKK